MTKGNIKKSCRFTLVELLVTISIMIILISILMPALANANAVAKKTACSGNLKQFGLASNMYVMDCNGCFPVSSTDNRLWDYQLMDYVNYDFANYKKRNDFSIYHCPSGKPNPIVNNYRARGFAYNRSIAYNIEGTALLSKISDPSFTVTMTDAAYEPLTSNIELAVICGTVNHAFVFCSNYGENISYRHLSKTNVLFVDGHVKSSEKGYSLASYGVDGWIPKNTKWINTGVIY